MEWCKKGILKTVFISRMLNGDTSNLHHTLGITAKRVMSIEAHIRG